MVLLIEPISNSVLSSTTGRPGYHPATPLKLYLYGYINQVQSSRRLEREAGRSLKLAVGLATSKTRDLAADGLFDVRATHRDRADVGT